MPSKKSLVFQNMSKGSAILQELEGLIDSQQHDIRLDEPMARHTTLRLGGPADLWIRPKNASSLASLLRACASLSIPVTIVGGGSNLLVRDGGIRGCVINIGRLNKVWKPQPSDNPGQVIVEGGASTGRLLRFSMDEQLSGVEFLAGVPGSVGGGLMMNAGTYLGEFTNVVLQVTSIHHQGGQVVRNHAECGFRYRDSDLPRDEIVTSATLQLQHRSREAIANDVQELRTRRSDREPKGIPNNGSTFKNPPGDFAGRLIESIGLKGFRYGGAVISPVHANWLVVDPHHQPRCTATDLSHLIEFVQEKVERATGIRLELELRIIGEAG